MGKGSFSRRCAASLLSLALACSGVSVPTTAQADEVDIARLQTQVDDMVGRIESATDTYREATERTGQLISQIADNEQRAAEIETQLPAQRVKTAASIKSMYLMQQSQPGLIGLLLSADDFNSFIAMLRAITAIHDHNSNEIQALADLRSDFDRTQAELQASLDEATARQTEALYALEDVRAARADLQAELDAARQAKAERERRAAAQKASTSENGNVAPQQGTKESAPAKADEALAIAEAAVQAANKAVSDLPETAAQATAPTAPASQTPAQPAPTEAATEQTAPTPAPEPQPETPAPQPTDIDQPAAETAQPEPKPTPEPEPKPEPEPEPGPEPEPEPEPEQEIESPHAPVEQVAADDSWAARIDAYLEGSPLAGMGSVFASAAATYGVDPRLSPAISCIESSKGAICFLPHNAWGWGSSSWGSWEEAINDHVAGLASGYGSMIDLEGARRYAGDDIYLTWYNLVMSEMSSI